MTKFILHGGFPRKEDGLNRSFYKELAKDLPEGGTVLLVYFAVRYDNTDEVLEEQSNAILRQAEGKQLYFVRATKEDFVSQLKKADGIYFHGGSTNNLLSVLREFPEIKSLIIGKTVAGSSAGAYAIASFGASHSEDAMREGLGLAPLRVICHYESLELPPAPGAVALLKKTAPSLELVTLADCEWRVFRY